MNHDSYDSLEPAWIELAPGLRVPAAILHFEFTRSRGPGGQNVNKLNTKAVLSIDWRELADYLEPEALGRLHRLVGKQGRSPSLVLTADATRSQSANRRACVNKLRALVSAALIRPKTRRRTRPTAGSVQRRRQAKQHRSRTKRLRRVDEE